MMFRLSVSALSLMVLLPLSSAPLYAQDATEFRLDRNMTVGLRGGVMTGTAHEFVYDTDGTKLSELVWDMQQNYTISADLNYRAGPRWSVAASGTLGINGNNYMNDWDWIGRPATAAWTHHSWHDDTGLDHYFALDANVAYDFAASDALDLKVLGGAKYTDLQWTARGGCYIYSWTSFRGDRGCFKDGEKGITYEQSLPAVYGGFGAGTSVGALSISGQIVGGLTVGANDLDHHWLRSLVFLDEIGVAPYLGAQAQVAYQFTDRIGMNVVAQFDKHFEGRGPTKLNGAFITPGDASGASLQTLNVSTGFTYKF
jgi:outer membrane protease